MKPLYNFYRNFFHGFAIILIIWSVLWLRSAITNAKPIPKAEAAELSFGDLPQRALILPRPTVDVPQLETTPDMVPILKEAGFQGEKLRLAYAVMKAESGGRPKALNINSLTGDHSYGLFQINMIGKLGPARLKQYNLNHNDDLFDPLTNAKVAYKVSNNGTNWKPWGAYKNGSYKRYLSDLPSSIL